MLIPLQGRLVSLEWVWIEPRRDFETTFPAVVPTDVRAWSVGVVELRGDGRARLSALSGCCGNPTDQEGLACGVTLNNVPPRADAINHVRNGVKNARAGNGSESRILTTRVGLRLPESLNFGTWERAGLQLARIADSSAWCLGDWLVYGQSNYVDRYRHAVETAGLEYQTLRNYAWVARRYELWRRHEKLSFQHHAEVAALPPEEQDRWLKRAEENGWSRNQLRNHRRLSDNGGQPPELASVALLKLSVDYEQVEQWREAARRSSKRYEQWVMTALDAAARRELELQPLDG